MEFGTELEQRYTEALQEELKRMKRWYCFVFAGVMGFRGAVIVYCHGILHGMTLINEARQNPGGLPLDVEIPVEQLPDEEYRGRILDAQDLLRSGLMNSGLLSHLISDEIDFDPDEPVN